MALSNKQYLVKISVERKWIWIFLLNSPRLLNNGPPSAQSEDILVTDKELLRALVKQKITTENNESENINQS